MLELGTGLADTSSPGTDTRYHQLKRTIRRRYAEQTCRLVDRVRKYVENFLIFLGGSRDASRDHKSPHETKRRVRYDNDNDNDTLREVQHLSDEGLALQARVYAVMTPRKRICCAVETCSLARCALTYC